MKIIQEQIKVMQHFANGGEVENYRNGVWFDCPNPNWNWNTNYRIKKQKKTITIEKWILEQDNEITIIEGNKKRIDSWSSWKKLKLLDTYEVEL